MSHFAVYECKVSDLDYVKKGLGDLGFEYKNNTTIVDYYGQTRKVDLAVMKDGKVLPLGFIQKGNDLELQADWFKVPMSEQSFTSQIAQMHSKYQVLDTCEQNAWSVDMDSIQFNEAGELEIMATQFA